MGLFTYRQRKLANGHAKITAVIVKHPTELMGHYKKQKTKCSECIRFKAKSLNSNKGHYLMTIFLCNN